MHCKVGLIEAVSKINLVTLLNSYVYKLHSLMQLGLITRIVQIDVNNNKFDSFCNGCCFHQVMNWINIVMNMFIYVYLLIQNQIITR